MMNGTRDRRTLVSNPRGFVACIFFTALVSLALMPATAAAQAEAKTKVRLRVSDVKGQYVKFDRLGAGDGLSRGQRGDLVRPGAGDAVGGVVVTAVLKEYGVGKIDGGAPRVGDQVVLRLKEVAATEPDEPAVKTDEQASAEEIKSPRKTRRQMLAEKRAKEKAEQREKWLARLEARGVKPWPVVSDEEQKKALEAQEAFVAEVRKAMPSLQRVETKHFIFVTNIPPQQAGPFVVSLDKMYEMMCQMYGIEQGQQVWLGKAVVFAFLNQIEFMQFEQRFMQHSPSPTTYGLCHQSRDGNVVISCYRGDQAHDFGQMLVHETSHGFIHRYKTPLRLPSWVNEGMAEYIGQLIVPGSDAVKIKQQVALEQLKQTGSLGGNFFALDKNIDTWQYGVAFGLNNFMIQNNQQAYVKFIEGMKEGMSWEESLQASFECTPQQLVTAYGRAIGMPLLRP